MSLSRSLRSAGDAFLLALAFLSRLAPARAASNEEMRAAVSFFPFAGALIGLSLLLPFLLGLFHGHPAVQAWLHVLLSAWLTRALHLDGLADVMDALGSGKKGEEFFAVLKDSRLGAFGAVALVLYILGQAVLAQSLFAASCYGPIFFAPLFGRCLPIVFSRLVPAHPDAGLGKLFSRLPLSSFTLCGLLLTLLAGVWLLGPAVLAAALILTGSALLFLGRLARSEGGYNGDFLGCVILAGEMAVLAAAAAAA